MFDSVSTRRDMLLRGGAGFGGIVLSAMLQGNPLFASDDELAPPARMADGLVVPHRPATAKRVIFLFMEGGPSHLDTFDPKPLLQKLDGEPLPESFGTVITPMGEKNAPLLGSKRKWKQHGESGTWVSDWLPQTAKHVDDICVIRSLWGNGLNHANGVTQMNTGSILAGRPSLGAWVHYGLGTENADLPAFVVLQDGGTVTGGPRNWGSGFMPAAWQGTELKPTGEPIRYLNPPDGVNDARQRKKLDFLARMNRDHQLTREQQTELDARIKSYELAYRMQSTAPEAVDLSEETEATRAAYGLDNKQTATFGRNCLLARRLAERGVRFIQLYHGAGSKWDAHARIEDNHSNLCGQMDQPVAALLADLKQRGLLEDTLVVWGGEFGRTPMSEKGDGRDHNPYGFTMWLAGGGVQGGQVLGRTDEVGLHAVEDRLHIHDFHATILDLLGVDHMGLVYKNKGRPERPTLNEGTPFAKVRGSV